MTVTTRPRSTTAKNGRAKTQPSKVAVANRGPDVDFFLIGSVGILCMLGIVMVYSATMVYSPAKGTGPGWGEAAMQVAYLIVGVLAALFARRLPGRFWEGPFATVLVGIAFAMQGYLAAARLLTKVGVKEVPLVSNRNGGFRWLDLGPVSFQPSDIAKLALILWVAKAIADAESPLVSWPAIKRIFIVSFSLCALVMAGNDLGTTLLLFGTTMTMLLFAGAPWRLLTLISAVAVIAVVLIVQFGGEFRGERMTAFMNSDSSSDKAFQANQSKIGFASGGLFGTGPGTSRQKWGYLPEADTDFIFAVIGEELGVAGTLLVLGSYLAFMASALVLAIRSTSRFCRFVGFGITTWIGVQALINIGVALSVLPTKGITLPFVSRGGSSLIMCLLAVGVLMSVSKEPV